jgi:signal peptidase I
MDPNYDQPTPGIRTHIIEFIQTLVVFLAIGSVIYLFAVQPHKVSGCSMCPNFQTGNFILTDKITYRFSPPQRGDIIVFKNPRDPSQDFIKRIMGIPGDKVSIRDGRVYLNGQSLKEPYLDPSLITSPGAFLNENQEVQVKPDTYLVFGDNRPGSSDSREWGYLPKENIIGKAFFRYWPKEVIGLIPHYSLP